jgi:Mg-chelatase subunit ChlD
LPYDEPDTTKAMIIMTDGEFNRQYHSGQGSSAAQAKALCDKIKEEDVVIFTVAFQAPEDGAEVLAYCATSEEHAFKASNGAELQASYQSIATSISDLRIKS